MGAHTSGNTNPGDQLIHPDSRPSRLLTFLAAAIAVGAATWAFGGNLLAWCNNQANWCRPPCRTALLCHPYAIEDYLTRDPNTQPKKHSDEWAPLGITEGRPISQVAAMFPPESDHSIRAQGKDDTHAETWTWHGISVTISASSTGGSFDPMIERSDSSPYYVSIPLGLMLGKSTIQDAVDAYPEVHDLSIETETEGAPHYYRLYVGHGAEGAYEDYYVANPAPDDDPEDDPAMRNSGNYPRDSAACHATLNTYDQLDPLAERHYTDVPNPCQK